MPSEERYIADLVVGPRVLDGWTCPTCRRSNWPWMRYCHHCREDRPLVGIDQLDAHTDGST